MVGLFFTGWAKKQSHYVRPLRSTAHLFKMPEPICVFVCTPQRRFVLNTSANSKLVGIYNTKWRHAAKVSNPAFDDYYGNFSIKG